MALTELNKKWMKQRNEDEGLALMNKIKMRMNKPVVDGFIIINMRTGKTRKPRQGEFRPLIIDYSDPSYEDGDIVKPDKR